MTQKTTNTSIISHQSLSLFADRSSMQENVRPSLDYKLATISEWLLLYIGLWLPTIEAE